MSESKHLGILEIDARLLLTMLRFPEDTRVHGLDIDFDRNAPIIRFKIEQANLPLTSAGQIVPKVNAEFTDGSGPAFMRWV